jgi:outer membrane protein TolC
LLEALRVASLANLDIAQARQVVYQARASALRAESQLLPNLNFGSTFVRHEGQLQNTAGNVQPINRDSLFIGAGPSLALGLSDALFAPAVASRILDATVAGERRVTNDTLLVVADAYFAVLRARRRLVRIDETLDHLTSDRVRELRDNSRGLLPLTEAFVKTGAAAQIDKVRVEVEIARRQDEFAAIVQEYRVASAELARLLHQDPAVLLWPLEDPLALVEVPGAAWAECAVEELVTQALANRPDLAESRALVEAALARLRNANWRHVLPNLVVNYSGGVFGGGPAIVRRTATGTNVLGLSGIIADFGGRGDFNVSLVWTLQGAGLGNLAEKREQRAVHEQARLRQAQTIDRVVTQVVQARELVRASLERVRITRAALFDDQGRFAGPVYRSLYLNFFRFKREGRSPLELLDSLRSLNDVLEAYGQALTDLERARFRLLVALGMPAQGLLDPRLLPTPPGAANGRCEPAGTTLSP